jgi:hypothetical protein
VNVQEEPAYGDKAMSDDNNFSESLPLILETMPRKCQEARKRQEITDFLSSGGHLLGIRFRLAAAL